MRTYKTAQLVAFTFLVLYIVYSKSLADSVTSKDSKCFTYTEEVQCDKAGDVMCALMIPSPEGFSCKGNEECYLCNNTLLQYASSCRPYEKSECTYSETKVGCGDSPRLKGSCKFPTEAGVYICACENTAVVGNCKDHLNAKCETK